jgi:uncharacterized membrane protein YebE (DUF533 family)
MTRRAAAGFAPDPPECVLSAGPGDIVSHTQSPTVTAAGRPPFPDPVKEFAMADWKKMAKALILADGYIEEKETEIIRKELMADGVINKSEAEFLIDLRNSAPKAVAKFHEFVFEVVQKAILADESISAEEAKWLEKFLLADGKVDDMEKAFLKKLKAAAKKTSAEFDALVKKYAP